MGLLGLVPILAASTAVAEVRERDGIRRDELRRDGGRREGSGRDVGRQIGVVIAIGVIGTAISEAARRPRDEAMPSGRPRQVTKPRRAAKKGDKKKPPVVAVAPIDDCLVIIQYDPGQIPTPEEDPTSAQNPDLKASADIVKKGLPGAQSGTVASKGGEHLDDILKGFKKDNKCCTKIKFFGHGTKKGALLLPHKAGSTRELGGSGISETQGPKEDRDALASFKKLIKDTLCADPKPKGKYSAPTSPQVKFNACHSANQDADVPIAEELSKAGIRTEGFTGVCNFTGSDGPVFPEPAAGGSEIKKFPAPDASPPAGGAAK